MEIASEAELAECVLGAEGPLTIQGHGTKHEIGCAASDGQVVSLAAFSGITAYEPGELYLTAKAGTPLAEVQAALDEQGQMLIFEPPFVDGTLGGMVAVGLAGARRFRAGGVRDSMLGIRAVSGRGEIFKAGGTVVKNVTGYDLPRVLTGSFGSLAILTEVTLKVLPKAAGEQTLIWELPKAEGLSLLRKIWQSPYEPTGLRYLNGKAMARLEGVDASIQARAKAIQDLVGAADDVSEAPWPHLNGKWRVMAPPADAAKLEGAFDWAGGLCLSDAPSADYPCLKMAGADVYSPNWNAARLKISKRLKAQFDPRNILNPGRLHPEL